MILSFKLTMPNVNSWNGKWSGEGEPYFRTRRVTDEKKAEEIREQGYYYYRWPDGWGAGVVVEEVSREEAERLDRESQGFCGYDWMIDSILSHGKILADHEVEDK